MGALPRIELLYDPGTATVREDGFFVNPPFYGVIDGYSAPYGNGSPPRPCRDMTGGQLVVEKAVRFFSDFSPKILLGEGIKFVNREIRILMTRLGIGIKRSDLLPGASFVFVKIGDEEVEIIQGGDCFAVWGYNSGEAGVTINQCFDIQDKLRIEIARLMEKHDRDRDNVLEELAYILAEQRQRDVNVHYAVLNGQYALSDVWQTITISRLDLSFLFLFTDGFVPFEATRTGIELADFVIQGYSSPVGLSNILSLTRQHQRTRFSESHIDYPEATVLTLRW